MDSFKKTSILKRYNQFKHRTGLIYFLSVLQIVIAVAVLVWFFAPRTKGYLTAKPKAYLITNLKSDSRYIFSKGDLLAGSATPSAYIKVILKQPKIVLRAKADNKGRWFVKVPEKIPEKNYDLQLIGFNSQGKDPHIKLMKAQIRSNNVILQSKWYNSLKKYYTKVAAVKIG